MAIPKAEFIELMTAADLSYEQLGERINRSGRLVQRWVTAGRVPDNYEPIVRRILQPEGLAPSPLRPLAEYSDYALLDEIARRLQGRRNDSEESGWIDADPPDVR